MKLSERMELGREAAPWVIDRVKELEEAYAVMAMALVLCDATDPEAPVLNGEMWAAAMEQIDMIDNRTEE